MPPIDNGPKLLKPFTFHGVVFDGTSGDNVTARCFLCDREGKFCVNPINGGWECKSCHENGFIKTFLRRLYEESSKVKCDYSELVRDRKLLYALSLQDWGLCKSVITDEWMLPGYNVDRDKKEPKFTQLYLWRKCLESKRMRFICQGWTNSDDGVKTSHGFFCSKWGAKKPRIVCVEGLWDGACFAEISSRTRFDPEEGYSSIGTVSASLASNANVLAVPSSNVFHESWVPLFAGKNVTILPHSDHSRTNPKTGSIIQGAGIDGARRAVGILCATSDRPTSIEYLKWGEDGFDPTLKHGYDIRDHVTLGGKSLTERSKRLGELLQKVVPIPDEWIAGREKGSKQLHASVLGCTDWLTLQAAWKEAMFWNDGLDAALPAMLACAASASLPEDLLWLKVVSPPSTGKTELAEALALLEEGVVIVSTFTGLHSGVHLEDGRDGSLISILGGMCFIIKEGDTLLRLDNKEKVWSELRDAFDKNTRTHYKNGISNQYLNHAFSHILCGTASLHEMDSSELGQRYLDIVIMDRIDHSVDSRIGHHKVGGYFNAIKTVDDTNESGATPEKLKARRLTAGYLKYLRENIKQLSGKLKVHRDAITRCADYGQFIAYFRARPSSTQTEEVSRELSPRVSTQVAKLASTLAVTLGKDTIDEEVLSRCRKVCLDTSRGTTFNIAKMLFQAGTDGMTSEVIAAHLLHGYSETKEMMKFLKKIEVVEAYKKDGKVGIGTAVKWRLTRTVSELYERVVGAK